MLNATGKKTAEYGFGKLLSYGTGKLKESATNALSGGESKMSASTAQKLDKWLFKPTDMSKNISTRDVNILTDGKFDVNKITEEHAYQQVQD